MRFGSAAMFFVLAYGWDGTGYRRFLSPDGADWHGRLDVPGFLGSDVALTLYGMAAVLVPLLLWMQAAWWGARPWRTAALVLLTIFGLALGSAVAAAALLTNLGGVAGAVATAVLLAAGPHPPGAAGALPPRVPARGALVGSRRASD